MRRQNSLDLIVTIMAVLFATAVFFSKVVEAGSLEPTNPPGPTMKTLDEIPPTWSQKLDSTDGSNVSLWMGCDSSRFECIWLEGSPAPLPQAVLDKETGLVWERSPSREPHDWTGAYFGCLTKKVGGRYGWRLPSFEEICSLWEDNTLDYLPSGHPFQDIQDHYYWSSTTSPSNTEAAMVLRFGDSDILPMTIFGKTTDGKYMWCVRGGKGNDGY